MSFAVPETQVGFGQLPQLLYVVFLLVAYPPNVLVSTQSINSQVVSDALDLTISQQKELLCEWQSNDANLSQQTQFSQVHCIPVGGKLLCILLCMSSLNFNTTYPLQLLSRR